MKTNQFITASILGGIIHFFIGYLIYGILLSDVMSSYTNQNIMRKEDEMIFWSILIGSFGFGTLLTFILSKAGVNDMKAGFKYSAIIGALIAIGMNFTSYGTANIFNNIQAIFIDVFAMIFVIGLPGAGIGFYLKRLKS